MIIAKKYEVPDSCPADCRFKHDISKHGQNSICIRCPVFKCSDDFPLIPSDDYRSDWAKIWCAFFRGEIDNVTLPFQAS